MITRALFSLKGLMVSLIMLCLWLGLLTHHALSVVEEASAARRRDHPTGGGASGSARENGTPRAEHRDVQQEVHDTQAGGDDVRRHVAMLELQLAIVKRKLVDAGTENDENGRQHRRKVEALEEALALCRQQSASPPPPPPTTVEPQRTPQSGRATTSKAPDPVLVEEAPAGLDAYEQEQWRIRQYMRAQREGMLRDRRDFVRNHQPSDRAAAPPTAMPSPPRGGAPPSGWGAAEAPASIGLGERREHLASLVRAHGPIIPVVVVAYQRAPLLAKCIDTILRRMPRVGFQLIVSQDSWAFPEVTQLLDDYQRRGQLVHMVHRRNSSGGTEEELAQGWEPYFAISHHYQFILEEVFAVPGYERVIFVEEDIEVGVDFFDYMTALSPLLDLDPTLYCISAWNDNGKATHIADPRALYRTDFFPGLGWMMSRALWLEFAPIWPKGFWDDWLRQPQHRKGRSCIRPEVPRSFTWCTSEGVSQGQFCAEHLANIKLADTAIAWAAENLSVLVKDAYDRWMDALLATATEVHAVDELDRVHVPANRKPSAVGPLNQPAKELKLVYHSNEEFEHLAQLLNLMDDFKDNVPRTAYKGVVTFRRRSMRVHLVSASPLYR